MYNQRREERMYQETLLFGVGFYEIFITIALIGVLFLADKMAVKRVFSIGLQRVLICSIMIAVAVGFLGAIFFQAIYRWIETGIFSMQSGMTFYGGILFGAAAFLLFWFFGSKLFKVQQEAKQHFKDVADIAAVMIPMALRLCWLKQSGSWLGCPVLLMRFPSSMKKWQTLCTRSRMQVKNCVPPGMI